MCAFRQGIVLVSATERRRSPQPSQSRPGQATTAGPDPVTCPPITPTERLPGDNPFPGRTGWTRCRTRAAEFVRASGEAGGASAATIQVTIGAVPIQRDRGSLVRHSSSVIRLPQRTVGTRRRFPFFWCTVFEAAQRAAHDVVAARRCPQRCDWQTREHPSWEHCWDVLNSPLLSPDSGADAAVMAGGGRQAPSAGRSAPNEVLDQFPRRRVVVLHGRTLHEVGAGTQHRTPDAAIHRDLARPDGVDDDPR